MTKKCTKCKCVKDLSCFAIRNTEKKTIQSWCRECHCKRNKIRWQNDAKFRKKHTIAVRKQKLISRQYVFDYLKEHPCVDCGNNNPIVLEFDHISNDKISSISYLLQLGRSIVSIQKEIDKCQVVCANCHRIRTAKRGKHFRFIKSV